MPGNRLAEETSPYLQQHKDNPVHWQPWGPDALARARNENKPILLSVGYAACHWCHVMAHESFEDEATAALMNRDFVNIKVDREERPDLDGIYQSALALLGQQGGWPLTMFLTPEARPFWGGTYFPPEPRWGRPSFRQVLESIAGIYRDEPDKVAQNVAALDDALGRLHTPGDAVPLKQQPGTPPLRMLCLCGSGEVVPDKPAAAENPLAKEHKPQAPDPTDNAKSLGFLVSYGGFRFLDLGDLTWNIEYKLVAPTDKIGPVDVYQVTHHGLDSSNNPVLINTVRPRVAVYDNGPRKGCHPKVTSALRRVPDIKAIYQMHFNVTAAASENTDPAYIANPKKKAGQGIKIAVAPDGRTYTITAGDRGKPRRYETRLAEK